MLNMRLGGDQKAMAANAHTFWPSFPTLEVALSIAKDGLWHFGPRKFGSWWIVKLNMRLEGGPKRPCCCW